MSTRPLQTIAALLLTACTSAGTPTVAPGGAPPPWTLTWHDEFDGAAGAQLDTAAWVADTGGGGWGNQEREFYTAGAENASLDGAGHLVITARAEAPGSPRRCWYGTCKYTSARFKTKGRVELGYGRFEAAIRVPRGQGLWPAFWLLGRDIDAVGWPQCGEIDVMENIGREPGVVHGTLHGPGYSGANGIGAPYTLSAGAFADDFHVFAVEWEPGVVRWLVDDRLYHQTTPAGLPAGARWVFDHPFFILLNVAVGGSWPGDPDASTAFPQEMLVDYVRVYRR